MKELLGGCICCDLSTRLVSVLGKLASEKSTGLVCVEASGLATPGMVRQLLAGTDLAALPLLQVNILDAARLQRIEKLIAIPVIRQGIEWEMRSELYAFEHFDTDNVPTPAVSVPKAISNTGWDVEARWEMSEEERGARRFDPVIAGESDLDKMRFPKLVHDGETSQRRLEAVREIFDNILPVELVGSFHPDRIRSYLRENLAICRNAGCQFEVILKDTHTCEGHPERFDDWCRIAREEINSL